MTLRLRAAYPLLRALGLPKQRLLRCCFVGPLHSYLFLDDLPGGWAVTWSESSSPTPGKNSF